MLIFDFLSNGIIHRDLKPENLLCEDATNQVIKISDFGFAIDSVCEPAVKTPCGTTSYVAPEVCTLHFHLFPMLQVLRGEVYDNKCDIWY